MEILTALVAGILFAAGVYLLLRRNLVKLILGIAVISNAANLVIFTGGRLVPGNAAFVPSGTSAPVEPYADPLPQAFILTAIVIGFGVLAFATALVLHVYRATGADDLDALTEADD